MDSSSRMLAGSVGKTFFAALFMRLVAEGRLNLDQKIAYWLEDKPWFKRLPNAEEITFRMLLNHSSGLPEYVESPEFVDALWRNPDRVWTPEELLSYVLDKPAKFPAGYGWSYADTNYILAGYVAEQITGESLYSQIRQQLLLPFGLSHTEPSVHRKLPRLAVGYSMPSGPFHINGRTVTDGQLPFSPQFEWAGGGFVSQVSDLARWAKVLYEGGAFDPRLMPVVLRGVPAGTGPGDQYGLGVQIRQTAFGISYGHGGWYPGYLTEMEYFPRYRIAIAVQVNTDDKRFIRPSVHAYTLEIIRNILGGLQPRQI